MKIFIALELAQIISEDDNSVAGRMQQWPLRASYQCIVNPNLYRIISVLNCN